MSAELQNIIFPAESVVNPNITTCFSVNTGTDSAVEGDEEFVVSVIDANGDPADTVLITAPSTINVVIQDNTGEFQSQILQLFHTPLYSNNLELVADFETEVSISEDEGPVQICVSLSATSFENPVVLQAVTEPGTASSKIQQCNILLQISS